MVCSRGSHSFVIESSGFSACRCLNASFPFLTTNSCVRLPCHQRKSRSYRRGRRKTSNDCTNNLMGNFNKGNSTVEELINSIPDVAAWSGIGGAMVFAYRLVAKANKDATMQYLHQVEFLTEQLAIRDEMIADLRLRITILENESRNR